MNSATALLSPMIGWTLLVTFSLLWVMLGLYWGNKSHNFEDHALAGRNIGLAFGSATAVATWVTSNTTMLAPQFALQLGIWGMLAYSTASFGLFLFAPMAKRIRQLMPEGYTSGDFIRLRYGRLAWKIFLILTLFYSITWLVTMAMAGGILLNALSGIPYRYGMTIILSVCVLYTIYGGLFAVIGTDFIQSVIILIGIIIVGFAVLTHVSISQIHASLIANKPALLNVMFPAAIMAVFNNLFFGLGEIFHNNVWWSRAFAFRKGIGKKAFLIAGFIWLPIPVAAGFIALASGVLNIGIPSPDMVGPLVVANVLGKAGAIVIFIVIFCSLASSIDSLLAATSDLITEDVYHKMFRPQATNHQLKKAAQRITLALGIGTWLICLLHLGTLASVLFFAGPLVASMIWPIITGLFWKRASPKGAISGMVLGSVIGLIIYFQIGWYVASLSSVIISMLCVIVFAVKNTTSYNWHLLNEGA